MPNQTYTPSQMAAAIASIGQATLQTKTTTQNGTVTPDAGYEGLSEVIVNVPTGGGSSVTVEPLSVTQNGTYQETGKAFSPVTVEVQPSWTEFISAVSATNITDAITILFSAQQNQTGVYTAVLRKEKADYVENQLVAVITYANSGKVDTWPAAFMRYRTGSYSPASINSTTYDSVVEVGDKFYIFEV